MRVEPDNTPSLTIHGGVGLDAIAHRARIADQPTPLVSAAFQT
jgi:hypothetical protein